VHLHTDGDEDHDDDFRGDNDNDDNAADCDDVMMSWSSTMHPSHYTTL